MKKILVLCLAAMLLLCSCNFGGNRDTAPVISNETKSIVGKWIDITTEQTVEYTADGYYYEYINEGFTADKTKYILEDGKIYYYLEGDAPDYSFGIDYEIKNGNLIIAGALEYKPMEIDISSEE